MFRLVRVIKPSPFPSTQGSAGLGGDGGATGRNTRLKNDSSIPLTKEREREREREREQ